MSTFLKIALNLCHLNSYVFFSFIQAVILAIIGAWILGAVFVLSARLVKRVLKSFRSAPVSAPLETISRRPAWFPLQLRT